MKNYARIYNTLLAYNPKVSNQYADNCFSVINAVPDSDYMRGAFVWSWTPQGHKYWHHIEKVTGL